MAGHSQFKNIMYRKGAQDAKRARAFGKITREIIVAVKSGLPDPASNPRLRAALSMARQANLPKDNIDRAIKKALGSDEGTNYEEIRYEGYGPGGVAIIVECLTDNRNRTAPDVRSAFAKLGGHLGETGSVSFMFERTGVVVYPKGNFDEIFDVAATAGADNVEDLDSGIEVTTSVDTFGVVRDACMEKFGDPTEAKVIWKPLNTTSLDEAAAKSFLKLIDILEDNDDVQHVYSNADIADDILERLAA